jgi:hypothetical protein
VAGSAWIVKRVKRYRVHFKPGGREAPTKYGGTFGPLAEARARKRFVLLELAAMRLLNLLSTSLVDKPTAPTLADACAAWRATRIDVSEGTRTLHRVALARVLDHFGPDVLLLGLLGVEDTRAADVLGALNVTIATVRAQVAAIIGEGDHDTSGQIPFTPRSKKVLELALRECVSLGDHDIRPEHILMGLVREHDGVAARILLEHIIDMDTLESLLEIAPERPGQLEAVQPSPMSANLRIALGGALAWGGFPSPRSPPGGEPTVGPAEPALSLYARHGRQLGGVSPPWRR